MLALTMHVRPCATCAAQAWHTAAPELPLFAQHVPRPWDWIKTYNLEFLNSLALVLKNNT